MAKKRMYSFAKRNIPAKVFFQRYLVHSHLSFCRSGMAGILSGRTGRRLPGQHRAAWHGICRQQCRVRTDGIWRKQCALPVSEDWVDPRRHHGGIVGICSFNWDLRKCQGRIAGVRSMEQLVWHYFTVTFKRLAVERWREQYWKRETLSQWNDLHP